MTLHQALTLVFTKLGPDIIDTLTPSAVAAYRYA
jgi:hypothetical protein